MKFVLVHEVVLRNVGTEEEPVIEQVAHPIRVLMSQVVEYLGKLDGDSIAQTKLVCKHRELWVVEPTEFFDSTLYFEGEEPGDAAE